jgi:hypothetical protein
MKRMTRRDFMKVSGTGLAGLAVAVHFPMLTPKRALASTGAWKFGVMADTQWKSAYPNGGENPNSCAVSIINALNAQFISHGCRYVIQVGDLVDVEVVSGVRTLPTRANAAQALYDAGIGFFPVRGNHEGSQTAAGEIQTLFPQTQGNGANVYGATNFASPFDELRGLSYSFDYENIRCVLIDQFTRTDGSNYLGSINNNAVDQVSWVDSMLASRPSGSHAFVFSHKNMIGQNHKDVLFGGNLTANAGARDEFISSLQANSVRYQLGGHDHMHHRSIVKTSNGASSISQIICSSNSYKFYTPASGDDGRETPLQQELYTIGYYIFTIDGPRVYVDYYSSSHGSDYGDIDLLASPGSFNFYLRESFGYSLNGKQFQVAHGESFTGVQDTYNGTTAKILSGTNGNGETDYLSRALVKTVNTGWSDPLTSDAAASNILSLWGMADNLSLYDANLTGLLPCAAESKQGDTYTLSLKYDPLKVRPSQLISGKFCLAARELGGAWVNAADLNFGGSKTFKYGPWRSTYGLGTYGVDPSTSTVWAVVNRDGDFAAKLL